MSAQAAALFGRDYLRINASPAAAQGEVLALDLATEQATKTLLLLAEEAATTATVDRVKELVGTPVETGNR